jgi:DNA-binding Lrp family transcriptional regulator
MPMAFIFITTEPPSMVEVLKQVRAVAGVEEAEMVYGVYDIVAKIRGETMDKLKQTITENIRKIHHLQLALTIIVHE